MLLAVGFHRRPLSGWRSSLLFLVCWVFLFLIRKSWWILSNFFFLYLLRWLYRFLKILLIWCIPLLDFQVLLMHFCWMCSVLICPFRNEMKLTPHCGWEGTGHHEAVFGGKLRYPSLCQLFPGSLFKVDAMLWTIQVQTYISSQVDMFQVN